jgi:hypothetical protein
MDTFRKALIGSAMIGTTLLGGAVGASLIGSASAQDAPAETTTTVAVNDDSTATTEDDATTEAEDEGRRGDHAEETELTGDQATQAIAAAEAAQPDATVERAETDSEGDFEVHMTLEDGSDITVKLDADFNVTETVEGNC